MSNAGHYYTFGGCIATQFVSNDHARASARGAQQFTEEPLCSEAVALGLNENIDDDAVLIHCSPEIMPRAIDIDEGLHPDAICRLS